MTVPRRVQFNFRLEKKHSHVFGVEFFLSLELETSFAVRNDDKWASSRWRDCGWDTPGSQIKSTFNPCLCQCSKQDRRL